MNNNQLFTNKQTNPIQIREDKFPMSIISDANYEYFTLEKLKEVITEHPTLLDMVTSDRGLSVPQLILVCSKGNDLVFELLEYLYRDMEMNCEYENNSGKNIFSMMSWRVFTSEYARFCVCTLKMDVNTKVSDSTVLFLSSELYIIEYGTTQDEIPEDEGISEDFILYIIERGADLSVKNEDGKTIFQFLDDIISKKQTAVHGIKTKEKHREGAKLLRKSILDVVQDTAYETTD
jgi:hypothetical protein